MKFDFLHELKAPSVLLPFLALLYIACRSVIFFTYTDIVIWPDSADYARISGESVWSEKFWMAHRPTMYPYLLKSFSATGEQISSDPPMLAGWLGYKPSIVLGRGLDGDTDFVNDLANVNVTSLAVFQLAFSVFSWIVFAMASTASIKSNWLRLTGYSLILVISLDQNITIWDRHVLTESFSISLFLLCVTMPFAYVRNERPVFLVLAVFAGFVYAGTKGTDAYMLLALSFLWIVVPFISRKSDKLGFLMCGASLLTISLFNFSVQEKGYRGVVPLMNVLNSRIIADGYEDTYGDFRDAGMPEIPGTFFEQHWYAPFDTVPGLRDWLMDEGPTVYKKYLITHPAYLFIRPFNTPESSYNQPVYLYYDAFLEHYGQPKAIGSTLLFAKHSIKVFVLLGFVAIAAAVRRLTRLNYFEIAYFSYILLMGILLSLVVWHGDVIEIDRHMIQVNIQLRLSLVLIAIYCINILSGTPVNSRRGTSSESG